MDRFVIDASAVLRLAGEPPVLRDGLELYAPTYLRSETLSALHVAAHRGDLERAEARARLDWITDWLAHGPVRLLGDAVLKAQAWKVADQLGWAETYAAEYVAMAQLRRCPLVTVDDAFRASIGDLVAFATLDDLR